MKRKRNYSRFYAIAKAKSIDLDQHKEVLVSVSYTHLTLPTNREV